MATTQVHRTTDLRGLVSYVRDEEVHHENEYNNGQRVLASDGIYCTPNDAYFQMREVQRLYGKHENKVQALHVIQSFDKDQFDPSDPSSIERALEVARDSMAEAYPNRQVGLWAQADGKGQNVHVHSAINSTDLNGRVLNGKERSFYYVAEYTDKSMEKHGYTTNDKECIKKGYVPEEKVNKGSAFANIRVIEEKMKNGMTEAEALQDAINKKELPNTEYAKIAIESTIQDERVHDLNTFKHVLKSDYEITYKTGDERGRKTGIYEYDYLDQSTIKSKRSTRENKLGKSYMEKGDEGITKQLERKTKYKEDEKDVEVNKHNEPNDRINTIKRQQQNAISQQTARQLQRQQAKRNKRDAEDDRNKQQDSRKPSKRSRGFELGD